MKLVELARRSGSRRGCRRAPTRTPRCLNLRVEVAGERVERLVVVVVGVDGSQFVGHARNTNPGRQRYLDVWYVSRPEDLSIPEALDAVDVCGARPRDDRMDVGAAHLRRGAGPDAATGRVLRRRRPRRAARACRTGAVGVRPSRVAVALSNGPEYVETMIGAFRAGPCRSTSITTTTRPKSRRCSTRSARDAVVYHRRLGPLLADAGLRRSGAGRRRRRHRT